MQSIKKDFKKGKTRSKSPALKMSPQKKGVCLKVYTRTPKKAQSARTFCCFSPWGPC